MPIHHLNDTLADGDEACQGEVAKLGNHFVRNPLFIPSRSRRCKPYTSFYGLTLDGDGYLLPDAKDHKILMALLSVLDDDNPIVTVSRHQLRILQGLKGRLDTARNQRIDDALEGYCNLHLFGTVGVKDDKQRIDCYVLDRFDYVGGKIEVRFNSEFIKQARPKNKKGKGKSALIRMDEFNALHSPFAMRLYEFLAVYLSGQERAEFSIPQFVGLMGKRFLNNSNMRRDIQSALNEIQEKTGTGYSRQPTKNNRILFKTSAQQRRDDIKKAEFEERQEKIEDAKNQKILQRQQRIREKNERLTDFQSELMKEKREYYEQKLEQENDETGKSLKEKWDAMSKQLKKTGTVFND